jgi:hypothetical protein
MPFFDTCQGKRWNGEGLTIWKEPAVAAPANLSRLKSARSPFYKGNPANALKTEQIR